MGTARQVNYHDNAHAKRAGSKISKNTDKTEKPVYEPNDVASKPHIPGATISYTAIMQDGEVRE